MNSILITGCNRGLGLGLVKSLIKHQSSPKFIFATCRAIQKAPELEALSQQHQNLRILEIDLKDFDKYEALVKQIESVVGEEGLNVLFNNAGMSPKASFLGLPRLKPADLIETYTINTVSPLMLSKAFIPLLKKASKLNKDQPLGTSRAAILNMSSILASMKLNTDGSLYHYRTSKAAMNSFTKSLSVDLKNDGIVSVALHPGWIKTDLGGPKAPLEVEPSCDTMIETILKIDKSHNGGFLQFDGKVLPW